MRPWIATVFLAIANKAVVAAPSPEYTPQPIPVYTDCNWIAHVCWCTNINGYNERVSNDWCFNIQDDDDWEENYGQREDSIQYSESEEESEEEYEEQSEGEYEEQSEGGYEEQSEGGYEEQSEDEYEEEREPDTQKHDSDFFFWPQSP